MLTVSFLLVFAAFCTTIASAAGRCPLWVPTLLVVLMLLLQQIPLR